MLVLVVAFFLISFSSVFAQTAVVEMVKNINPIGDGEAGGFFELDGALYFGADDGVHGYELWKSDGTAGGTVLVKDINPGGSSGASSFFEFDGAFYFGADDGINGAELWKSDGTEGGTVLVKDINPGGDDSYANEFVEFDGALYFRADDGVHGYELWKSDGTAGGTVLVKDINPSGDSEADEFFELDGILYFSATDGENGYELWALTFVSDPIIVPTPARSRSSSSSTPQSRAKVQAIFAEYYAEQGVPTTEENTITSETNTCSPNQTLTQNLKAPSRNGQFNSYTQAIVTEAIILQAHLNRLGFNSGPEDGILGPLTDGAIKRMQTSLRTIPDGYVGPLTRALLNKSCGEGGL